MHSSHSLGREKGDIKRGERFEGHVHRAGKSRDAPPLSRIPFHLVNALWRSSGTKLRQQRCYVRSRCLYREANRKGKRERQASSPRIPINIRLNCETETSRAYTCACINATYVFGGLLFDYTDREDTFCLKS